MFNLEALHNLAHPFQSTAVSDCALGLLRELERSQVESFASCVSQFSILKKFILSVTDVIWLV